MSIELTPHDLRLSTLIFALLAVIVTIPLHFTFKHDTFQDSLLPITVASAVFWGVLSVFFIFGYWDLYYGYFYPAWIRPLTPLSFILYGCIGLGLWWIASRQSLPVIWIFTFLGGVYGIVEHAFAIYGLRILEKVPLLQNLSPLPVLVFSFFEYALYWSLVAWIALGITKLL
ncbi:MAG TPA: hypothetical protein G4O11_07875 [Anaerolineae bacterium]|nr:hypothetical protein [Anaerolineae bacterium]